MASCSPDTWTNDPDERPCMITLQDLAELYERHRDDARTPVGPLLIGDRSYDVDRKPLVLGCVTLSRDSTYRESVAPSTSSAIRKARVQTAQGADVVDIGAESSNAGTKRVSVPDQLAALTPVVRQLVDDGIQVSVETYRPEVARACLDLGAVLVNFTGYDDQDEVFELVAEHGATLLMCRVTGDNVREVTEVPIDED